MDKNSLNTLKAWVFAREVRIEIIKVARALPSEEPHDLQPQILQKVMDDSI